MDPFTGSLRNTSKFIDVYTVRPDGRSCHTRALIRLGGDEKEAWAVFGDKFELKRHGFSIEWRAPFASYFWTRCAVSVQL